MSIRNKRYLFNCGMKWKRGKRGKMGMRKNDKFSTKYKKTVSHCCRIHPVRKYLSCLYEQEVTILIEQLNLRFT